MKRIEGWERRYSEFLLERKNVPFQWGYNDCMQFVARGVESMTGVKLHEQYPACHDEASAKKVLEDNGGIIRIMNSCFGQSSKNYMLAKRGDPVVIRNPDVIGGLVADCGQKIIAVCEDGWIRLPLSSAYRVWSL